MEKNWSTFTDDEVKRLKEWSKYIASEKRTQYYELRKDEVDALLARLDAAENAYQIARKVIDSKATWNELLKADNKWLTAAGKQ